MALALLLWYEDNPNDPYLEYILKADHLGPTFAYHPNDWVLDKLGVPHSAVVFANELHIAKAYG